MWKTRKCTSVQEWCIGWGGTLVPEANWGGHLEERTLEELEMIKGWEAPALAPGMFKGNWEEAWGLRGEEVLQALTDMASAMEKSVAAVGHQLGHGDPSCEGEPSSAEPA